MIRKDLFQLEEQKLLASTIALLEGSTVPLRGVSYQKPDFWNIPINESQVRDFANSPFWQDAIRFEPGENYNSCIRAYIITTIGVLPAAGLEFRFLLNEGVPGTMAMPAGVERHKDALFPPAVWQPTHIIQAQEDVFKIQLRNTTGVVQRVAVGIAGWQYFSPLSPDERSGIDNDFPDA